MCYTHNVAFYPKGRNNMENMTYESIKEKIDGCPDGLRFADCTDEPIKLYGTRVENGVYAKDFIRLPHDCVCGDGVDDLRHISTGMRVRFITDSNRLAVLGKTAAVGAFEEKYGFDVRVKYADGYMQSYHAMRKNIPCDSPMTSDGESLTYRERKASLYCGKCVTLMGGKKEIEILFPHYCETKMLKIGVSSDAAILPPKPYSVAKPVVFFGSSITQGIRASRPASTYEAQVSHMLDCDYINLGFSGNCRAQKPVLDYIKTLDMSAFVYDYDHNAPDPEFLRNTHEPFFRELREKFPTLPVIFMSKPDYLCVERDGALRRNIIYTTYSSALSKGDRNVYFIDGETMFRKEGVDPAICTFDGCHPNDLGFWCMAGSVAETLAKALERRAALCE